MNFLREVAVKPWEHAGEMEGIYGEFNPARTAGQTGLMMFLAVISVMFLLFMLSYYTRSKFPDWEMLSDPAILWTNTVVLAGASIALQLASNAARRDAADQLRMFLLASGVLTVIFVAGQLVAWQQLRTAGFYAAANPANAFFYLFTGLHGLHLLGGLWFMTRVGVQLNKIEEKEQGLQRVTLCATYWHYLLLVWLMLFTLLLRT